MFRSWHPVPLLAALACLAVCLPQPASAQVVYCNGVRYWGACPPAYVAPPHQQGPTPEQLEQRRQQALTTANERGIDAYNHGDYANALAQFELALEYSPYNPTIQHNIEKCKEKLAEQQAPAPASPGGENKAAALLGNTLGGASFDTANHVASGLLFKFRKSLSDRYDPVVPAERDTALIKALEEQRNKARTEAQQLDSQRAALEAQPMNTEQKKQDKQIKAEETKDLKKIQHLNFSIGKDLRH